MPFDTWSRQAPDETTDEPLETGDPAIDPELGEFAATSPGDLDMLIDRGETLQRTLQGRLADLGG